MYTALFCIIFFPLTSVFVGLRVYATLQNSNLNIKTASKIFALIALQFTVGIGLSFVLDRLS